MRYALHYNFVFNISFSIHKRLDLCRTLFSIVYMHWSLSLVLFARGMGKGNIHFLLSASRCDSFFLSVWWRWFHRMELSLILSHLSNWSNSIGLDWLVCYNKRRVPLPNVATKFSDKWILDGAFKKIIYQIHCINEVNVGPVLFYLFWINHVMRATLLHMYSNPSMIIIVAMRSTVER